MRLLLDFQEQFETVFMEIPHICKQKDRCRKGSRLIYEFFTERFGSFYSREWSIPEMTRACKATWLRAFFDCEGWVVNIPGKDRSIGLDCVNHEGMKQLRSLLKIFSIDSSLRPRKGRDTLTLSICGKDDLTRFQKQIDFLHPKKKQKLREALKSYDLWKWNLTDRNVMINILKEKVKFRTRDARLFSRKENLEKMKRKLLRFKIESNMRRDKNGKGTIYHYLVFYGKENLERLKALL